MKEQDKTLEKELKEMEIINLLDKEFKIIAYRSYQTWTRMYKLSENFNKEIENIKKLLIRTEEYNNWNEKHTRRNQKQTRGCRSTDQ